MQGEWSGELVHTARNGNQIVVASHQVLQRDKHGKPVAILEINRDITEHKQAEASLRSSEARLRALVSSIDDIVFEVDQRGRCLSAWTGNPQILAQSQDEPRHRIEDFLPTHSSPPAARSVRTRGEDKQSPRALSIRSTWVEANVGSWLASIASFPRTDTRKTLSVLVREITARKEAEIALQQSEERFRLLVEGVKDYAIYALDTEGRVVSWNSGAERIKGYSRDEIHGKALFHILSTRRISPPANRKRICKWPQPKGVSRT